MSNSYIISGFYGRGTKCNIVVTETNRGSWYCVQGFENVNFTTDELYDGVDVETLNDIDYFKANNPVDYTEELEAEVEDYLS